MEKLWPEVPPDLKYTEFRLPGTFRELVANQNITHEEIGRIIRCLALNTEMFITPRIEPEVHFYGKHQKLKSKVRKRVEALRKRRADASQESEETDKTGVTVTLVQKTGFDADGVPSPLEKIPSIPKEKKPPIVPLERKCPFPLEKPKRERPRRNGAAEKLQQDLFSLAESTCSSYPTGNANGAAQNRQEGHGTINHTQDIENDSRAVFDGNATMPTGHDSRVDAAWIPIKFEEFWERYPKKVAKQAAMKAFTKLVKSQNDVDRFMKKIIASIEWWKEQSSWKKDGGKFVPYPATWLNRGSWEDSDHNSDSPTGAEFLISDDESEADLIRRMQGG